MGHRGGQKGRHRDRVRYWYYVTFNGWRDEMDVMDEVDGWMRWMNE
jgi:hypothetical protein